MGVCIWGVGILVQIGFLHVFLGVDIQETRPHFSKNANSKSFCTVKPDTLVLIKHITYAHCEQWWMLAFLPPSAYAETSINKLPIFAIHGKQHPLKRH